MPAPADLVHQTSAGTGTGNLALSTINGRRSFSSAFGTGGSDVFDYFVSNRAAAEWERGTGHIDGVSGDLVRDTVLESSNAGSAVNFSAGTKDVVNDLPAAEQVRRFGGQTLTGGFGATPFNAGTKSSGTYTPDPADGNLQRAINGGAHTLSPPSADCTLVIKYTNNASAGAITTSGFTKVDGSFTTTNGHKFNCYIAVIDGDSHLNIVALQ